LKQKNHSFEQGKFPLLSGDFYDKICNIKISFEQWNFPPISGDFYDEIFNTKIPFWVRKNSTN
jgi:hypothetical protein